MGKSTALVIILAGYLATTPYLGNPLLAGSSEVLIIEQNTEQMKALAREKKRKEKQKFAHHPKHVRTNYYVILKHIQEVNKDYVSKVRRVSSDLENSIKKHGINTIVDTRDKAHSSCLDLALERIARKMTQKEFDQKTKQIAQQYYGSIQKTNVSAPIDFERESVVKACQEKMRQDVLFYERLLPSARKTRKEEADYKKLVQSAFSRKEYSEVILKRLSTVDGIYDAFIKSRVGFKGLFATGRINKMRAFATKYYKEDAEKIYPAKANRMVPKKMEGKGKTH